MCRFGVYFLFSIVTQSCFVFGQEVKEIFFGGVFEDFGDATDEDREAYVFKSAVERVNVELNLRNLLFKSLTEPAFTELKGPLKAKLMTCSLLDQQALVIFGPKRQEDMDIVLSICDSKDIAHVITTWVYNPADYRSTINFYPHSSSLSAAYFGILESSGWKSFTLFYEDNESLLRMAEFLNIAKNAGKVVVVRQLDEFENQIYRTTLKDALESGETKYVIDCRIEILEEVLRQIQQVGLLTNQHSFIFTNMDLQFVNLEPFQFSGANITGIRIFDPESELVATKNFSVSGMKTETALLADAVSVLAETINNKLSFAEVPIGSDSSKTSTHGDTIANHVKTSKNIGLTGPIEFDGSGYRSNFNLDVITLKDDGISKIGTWNESMGLMTKQPVFEILSEDAMSLRNKTLRVITCLTAPYCMRRETPDKLIGNDRYEGFAIDLIEELAKLEGFNYTFIVRDANNGAKNETTGKWSGMIGDVIDKRADLAITDLTITAEREQAVDFTSPFMSLGISILAQKPQTAPPSLFSFADPFALDTWVMLGLAYCFVSISFFIMGRLCQEEWTNPYPCIEEPEFLINQFSLQNSGWYTAGALMQQGTELGPIAISTRMVAGMWYFFGLIMAASYTANLAAFLATENTINFFTDVESLVQNREKYGLRIGAKSGGATFSFFKGKLDDPHKTIFTYMKDNSQDMVTDNKDGVKLAEEDMKYVFFMESISIEYETQRHCTLQQYGSLLDDKGYGIAMRKNSTYRTTLSTAILKLQSSGKLDDIKRTWWEEKRGGGQCAADDSAEIPPALAVKNVEGVFYVTIGGIILAVILVIIQMLLHTYKMSKKANMSFKEALQKEKETFLDFNSDVKPAIREKSSSRSKSKSSRGSESGNNNLTAPAPTYGFIPTIVKEELGD